MRWLPDTDCPEGVRLLERFTGVLGILAVLLAAWLGSTNRGRLRWRTVYWGLGLQFLFAFLVLRFS